MIIDSSQVSSRFIRYYERKESKTLTNSTKRAYKSDIRKLLETNPDLDSLDSLTKEVAIDSLRRIKRKGSSPASIRRFASTISRFFIFLGIEDVTYDSMLRAVNISRSNLPNEKSLPLDRREFPHILNAVVEKHKDRPNSYYCRRDLFFLHLMYFGGLTIPELINLDGEDIKSTKGGIEVLVDSNTSFSRRTRNVEIIATSSDSPILDYPSKRLNFIKYLSDKGIIKGNPPDALLLNRYGKRFSERNLRKVVCSYLEEAGIDKSTQSFRLGHILDLVKNGTEIETIARRLGISKASLQDTLIIFKGSGMFNQGEEPRGEDPSS